ncbi:NAD-dependent epimerase/dehydratase family protein [Pseudodesulfovibrio karagichevae]|uniref:NAD-dependent epimerase/dehydratase family protein n=1 Tax=Pseudodesulfovibrio karagichevae TaxID=3239305 RepID=A0ABV4K0X4_9BACT
MSKKFVVIGSNSFSGASFVDTLLDAGYEAIGVSRSPEPNPVFLPYKLNGRTGFEFHQLDLNHDLDAIIRLVADSKADYVVNFASQSMVGESWQHPEHWFMTNAVSTVKLHEGLRKIDSLEKYVHISTPEVYGTCEGLVPESTDYHPSTPYAVSRAAGDMSLMSFYQAYDFPVVFTRAANVFGPGQQLYRIVPRTILFFLMGRKLQLHGGGKSVRSFIHIRDVSECTIDIALKAAPPNIYHVSTKRNISIHDLVVMVAEQLGVSFADHVEIVGERLGKDAAYLLDSAKARQEFGWTDKISLEQGIEETISWVKDNLETLRSQPFDYIHKA